MTVRKLESYVIDCDSCDKVYAVVVALSEADVSRSALQDGWRDNDDGTHTCPKCDNIREHLVAALTPVFGPSASPADDYVPEPGEPEPWGGEEWQRWQDARRLDRQAERQRGTDRDPYSV